MRGRHVDAVVVPSQTTGGAIREDRLVLPIGPGVHWADVKPLILRAATPVGDRE
jgi:hypothetical protein